LAGLRAHPGGVYETIAAHKDAVIHRRQVGNDVAPLIVGDDHLGEFGRELDALGDHPDTRFRPVRAGDDAADIVDKVVGAKSVWVKTGKSRAETTYSLGDQTFDTAKDFIAAYEAQKAASK